MTVEQLLMELTMARDAGLGDVVVMGLMVDASLPPLSVKDIHPELHEVGATVWLNLEET